MFFAPGGIDFPRALDERLQRGLFVANNPERLRDLGSQVARLWPTLSKDRGLGDHRHYSFDSKLAEAYAAYYLPANALKFPLVLEEMRLLGLPIPEKLHIADFGAGPGTTLWGATLLGHPILYRAWEQSPEFASLGRKLQNELQGLVPIDARWTHGDPVKFARSDDFNFFVFQNSVHEIFSDPKERLERLLRITRESAKTPGVRWLILIEPALKSSSRDLLELRQGLLQAKHLRLWLPCLDNRDCGALEKGDDWCHEEVAVNLPSWINEVGREAGLRKESVLFSYLVFSIGEFPEVSTWPKNGFRMVSQRLERKGYTECHLCSQTGKIRCRVQHSKTTPENKGALEWSRGQILQGLNLAPNSDVVNFQENGPRPDSTHLSSWARPGTIQR